MRVRVLSDVAYCQGPVECPVADFPTELLWCPYPGCTRYQHPYEFCIEPIDVGDRIMWVVDLMTGCIQAAIPMDGEEVECSPSHVPVDFAMAHVLRPFAECHYYYQMAGWKSGECDEDTEGNDLDCADAVAGQGSGTGLVLVIGLILLTCRRRPPRRR
ncbi:MAG TPA: hypothetical protein P5076_07000 [Myxococcota bacterium]|nr:hypothetical protein [Myxococcota bacterium]